MFVYVIYEQDGVSHIAKVDDVKFKNDSVTSYNPKKTYKVRFTDDVFYRAFIISVGATPEEATEIANQSRIRLPSLKNRHADNTTTDNETTEDDCAQAQDSQYNSKPNKKKEIKIKKSEAELNTFKKVMKTLSPNDGEEINSLKLEISDLKRREISLKSENEKLRQLNFQLQHEVIEKVKGDNYHRTRKSLRQSASGLK